MRRLKIIKNNIKKEGLIKTLIWLFKCLIFYIKKFFFIRKKVKSIDYINNYQIKENEIGKKNDNVFIFCGMPFFDVGGGQRSASLARTFDLYGYKVNYIYAYKSTSKVLFNTNIPCVSHMYINDLSINNIVFNKNDIVIFDAPIEAFCPFLKKAFKNNSYIIYENIDNWNTSLGKPFDENKYLTKFLKYADLVTCTSKLLIEQINSFIHKNKLSKKNIIYSPNAVNDMLFKYTGEYIFPKDLIKGEKTLIYYGSLFGEWIDWQLINKVANDNPKSVINLIGNYDSLHSKMKSLPKNINFIKEKSQFELPAYLYYSDFAIIPFKPGEITDYVSPIKVFEYISMHKNVLSTNIPDIQNYPNTYLSNKPSEWNRLIKSKELNVNHKLCDEFTMNNTWSSRVDELIDRIDKKDNTKIKISVIVLNHNNKDVIFKCVNSLIKYNQRYNYEIIVVDNKSTDKSYELLKSAYKDNKLVKVIKNDVNGCSSGRNLGVKNSNGEYLLFLDSDQWVCSKYWLDNYISLINNNTDVGAIGWHGGWFNKNGYAYGSVDSLKHRYNNPNIIGTYDIGYLGTGGMLTRRSIFDEVGGFDEIYDPTCYEDTDFSLKIKHAGYKIVYCKYTTIGHFNHSTTKVKSRDYLNQFKKNSKLFVSKWKEIDYNLIRDFKKPNRIFKRYL